MLWWSDWWCFTLEYKSPLWHLKSFWCFGVESDYSVSSLSGKENKVRERELDKSVSQLFLWKGKIVNLINLVSRFLCKCDLLLVNLVVSKKDYTVGYIKTRFIYWGGGIVKLLRFLCTIELKLRCDFEAILKIPVTNWNCADNCQKIKTYHQRLGKGTVKFHKLHVIFMQNIDCENLPWSQSWTTK